MTARDQHVGGTPRDGYKSLIDRFREAARSHGVEIAVVEPETPPESMDEIVVDLINTEYIARDLDTGETARGESMKAAWANLWDVPKREIHNEFARWENG